MISASPTTASPLRASSAAGGGEAGASVFAAGGAVDDAAPQVIVEEPSDEAVEFDGDDDGRIVLESLEIDLSDLVAGITPARPAPVPTRVPQGPPPAAPVPAPAAAFEPPLPSNPSATPPAPEPADEQVPDLETVFERMRARAERHEQVAGARSQYDRALANLAAGRLQEAILDLQAAAREPSFRFQAAAALGRIHLSRGELLPGVEWLERAAEAPASSIEEGHSILYELAHALERMGEQERALAVLIELDTHSTDYRDVRARIEVLTSAQRRGGQS